MQSVIFWGVKKFSLRLVHDVQTLTAGQMLQKCVIFSVPCHKDDKQRLLRCDGHFELGPVARWMKKMHNFLPGIHLKNPTIVVVHFER